MHFEVMITGKVDVVQIGREVIGTDVRLTSKRRHGDCGVV